MPKKQPVKTNNQNNIKTNNQKTNINNKTSNQTNKNNINSQIKQNTTIKNSSVVKVNNEKLDKKDSINLNIDNDKNLIKSNIISSHNNKNDKVKLSASELNSEIYPTIEYGIEQQSDSKVDISLVVIGHVDSGKSTLMGHLLYLQGEINDKTLAKYEKESKRVGKNTFHFAWALDEDTEERKRGVTVDIAHKYFETKNKKVAAMDAPGHKDFVPNMISGTSAADCALLIIDSNKNAFESGFFQGGQTKEHAVLAKTLGVKQLIVCINKLEIWNWSKERFDYIKAQLEPYLETLEFKSKDVTYIPISGLKGINLTTKPMQEVPELGWYEGNTLIESIDSIENPLRLNQAPVRFTISDAGQSIVNNLQGFSLYGRLEAGVVFEDKEYLVMPSNCKVKIRSKI